MRKVYMSVIMVVIAFALVGGATFAYFSNTATNSNNTFTAGTFQLDGNRDNGDNVPGPMFYTTPDIGQTIGGDDGLYPTGLWAPGDEHHRVFQLENVGSLDGFLKKVNVSISGSNLLANKLQVKITTDPDGLDEIATGNLMEFASGKNISPIAIASEEVKDLHFWVKLPHDAGNEYQGENVAVSFTVYAETANN